MKCKLGGRGVMLNGSFYRIIRGSVLVGIWYFKSKDLCVLRLDWDEGIVVLGCVIGVLGCGMEKR